jgi:hypothetical protein
MKLTYDAYPKINCEQKTHADSGKLISYGLCANFLDSSTTDLYVQFSSKVMVGGISFHFLTIASLLF